MRVSFELIGGEGWTGGINYLENLLSALAETPEAGTEAVLFVGPDVSEKVVDRLRPFLVRAPIVGPAWSARRGMRLRRLAGAIVLQRDRVAEREFRAARIHVAFQHATWLGCRFQIPTLAWIADFQHRRLPGMFSKSHFLRRDVGYRALSHCATQIMVSSEDAKRDCERYYPAARGRIAVLPFAVRVPDKALQLDPRELHKTYELPERFFFLPNQLWKHKNHLGVLQALALLKAGGSDVTVVACGNPSDVRHPAHPPHVLDQIMALGLQNRFQFLGMIPYEHILPLMKMSIGLLNPSLFEGWSTTVEEAKAIGVSMVLSDLDIHREQAPDAVFFDPNDAQNMATVLAEVWGKNVPPAGAARAGIVNAAHAQARRAFAKRFSEIVQATAQAFHSQGG